MDDRTRRTLVAQALGAIEPTTKAVALPVHVATTFIRDPDNQYRSGFSYSRPDHATGRQCEAGSAAVEGSDEALLFGAGKAAGTSLVLARDPLAHIVAPTVMYWALRHWLANEAPRFGHSVTLVDTNDLNAVRAADKPGETKLVWIE